VDNETIFRLYGVLVANSRRSWKRIVGKWHFKEAFFRRAEDCTSTLAFYI